MGASFTFFLFKALILISDWTTSSKGHRLRQRKDQFICCSSESCISFFLFTNIVQQIQLRKDPHPLPDRYVSVITYYNSHLCCLVRKSSTCPSSCRVDRALLQSCQPALQTRVLPNSWKPSCSDPISANNKDFSRISFGTHLFLYFSKDEICFS